MTSALYDELRATLNRCSAENGSDTPDYILATYLLACLAAFDAATRTRDVWYEADDPGLANEEPDHD